MKRVFLSLSMALLFTLSVSAAEQPSFSKAGFYELQQSPRKTLNFNLGWRLHKGAADGAEAIGYDDSTWAVVNCPNGIEYNPSEASGGVNYRGEAWYRKHFTLTPELKDMVLKLHFEAVMGKSKVWLNGVQIGEHYGGYLPFIVELNENLNPSGDNVVAVWADNSDDGSYPPGKPQDDVDMTYFGGIYRDVWMVATGDSYITNPNEVDRIAGGGLFFHIDKFSKEQIIASVDIDVNNDGAQSRSLQAHVVLLNGEGKQVATSSGKLSVKAGKSAKLSRQLTIDNPELWSPASPTLHRLEVRLCDSSGAMVDGVAIRVGLRELDFRGKEGFFLNGELYPGKLVGGNRHQDFAYIGYSLPNNLQWRDAKIMKDGGCDVVRAAHYPADPAFMDACDELGLFFIVATPGWQFFNEDKIFVDRFGSDVRQMVRRDRNYPSVLMWEPVLNETTVPTYVGEMGHNYVHEEYPYKGAFTVCDMGRAAHTIYDVIYAHIDEYKNPAMNEQRSVFQREWGSMGATSTPNRMRRAEGEHAQKFQAEQYANSSIKVTSYETIYQEPNQFFGGALWHFFDHQAGCHAVPFFGGVVDAFRQPKYSYYLFASQRDVSQSVEPMIFLAHEQLQYSPDDVTVFTNCDEVRLTINGGTRVMQKIANSTHTKKGNSQYVTWETLKDKKPNWINVPLYAMPHHPVLFEQTYNYADFNGLRSRPVGDHQKNTAGIVAEGLIDGKVVASDSRSPIGAPAKIRLRVEDQSAQLTADGSDLVVVVAELVDRNGSVVRQASEMIKFEISGEGGIIGDESISANPRRLEWGSAPVLIRSTNKAGKITLRASTQWEGTAKSIKAGEITFESRPSGDEFLFSEVGVE